MTRTLQRYFKQAERLGACFDSLHRVDNSCDTVWDALSVLSSMDLAWVYLHMDLPPRMRARCLEGVGGGGAHAILEDLYTNLHSEREHRYCRTPSARRAVLIRLLQPRHAQSLLRGYRRAMYAGDRARLQTKAEE